MNYIRNINRYVRAIAYSLRVVFLFFAGRKIVLYTKNHPIYTSCFEENPPEGYVYYYSQPSLLDKWLMKRISICHYDAYSFSEIKKEIPCVVECEAVPDNAFVLNSDIEKIFVQSQYAGRFHFDTPKVSLLYPALSVNYKKEIERKNAITLLSVGYGGMLKGYDVLFEIFKSLKSTHKVKLIIAGTFDHDFELYPEISKDAYEQANFEEISQYFKNDPDVVFRSFTRKELFRDVYPKADIYVHLCRMETFGFSIIEAMSFGLPIVSCKFKAIPEMVEHGVNGYLVQGLDFDPLLRDYRVSINSAEWKRKCTDEAKQYLSNLINDPELRAEMSKHSSQIASAKFNVNTRKEVLKNTYAQILSKKKLR